MLTSLFFCCEKGVYPYKISLPEKELCYSHLNMEDITGANYTHAKGVCKDLEKKLGENHDLYIKSSTSLSVDVF